jgi:pyruvate dehydrogenase E2 component (dihydrolipoamide acetyltransferase)
LRQLAADGVRDGLRHVAATLFPDGTQAFGVRDAFARISVPTKLVIGADDRIIPSRQAGALPGRVAVHLFPGIGHMPHFEAREDVARLLAELVRSAD